ncbi:hypothetical protein PSEUDO9AG_40209 [Pseudomonas sp. 9Ag]|nr:hypothetical protein PSEUDO9AG_40209 [Pseudomonas sp. 9Ag]
MMLQIAEHPDITAVHYRLTARQFGQQMDEHVGDRNAASHGKPSATRQAIEPAQTACKNMNGSQNKGGDEAGKQEGLHAWVTMLVITNDFSLRSRVHSTSPVSRSCDAITPCCDVWSG